VFIAYPNGMFDRTSSNVGAKSRLSAEKPAVSVPRRHPCALPVGGAFYAKHTKVSARLSILSYKLIITRQAVKINSCFVNFYKEEE
jgi:hypothetical protein